MSTGFDLSQTDRLLTTTRAVRRRLDVTRAVPRAVVLECLEIALQAPTGSNTQGWRWLIIDDVDVKARLAELYLAGFKPYAKAKMEDPAAVAALAGTNMGASAWSLAQGMADVPVLIVPCLVDAPLPGPTSHDTAAAYASIYPAVWSFMLALRSRGLGSALTTLHLFREREAAELLGIPAGTLQACLLPVAYYTGTDFQPAPRRPLNEIAYVNHWGSATA